jgi:hypothetical protein
MRPVVVRRLAAVVAITIALAFGAALSPPDSNQRVEFLTHYAFQHHTNGSASQFTQILLEVLLIGESWGCLPLG